MTDLGTIFVELGLTQYLDAFVEQGFDTWETILDITESDFDALGVKLGHRRKLQRKIANSRGVSLEQSLASPKRPASGLDGHSHDVEDRERSVVKDVPPTTGKRKYRRHPKPDENAPERPPSAYVIFSNKMREELKGRHLSFTEIAKLVGENWQNLAAEGKEPYESQAFAAKEKYNAALAEYKKTDKYKKYSDYLADFKAKHSNQQPATDIAKRPKLENHPSTGSSDNTSSTTDVTGHESNPPRLSSAGSWNIPTQIGDYSSHSLPMPNMPGLAISHGRSNDFNQQSATASQGALLPGYRDIVIGSNQQQTLAWRDHTRDTMTQAQALPSRRPSGPTHSQSPIESTSYSGIPIAQNPHRRGPGFTPPLLTSESTGTSTGSGVSQGYYGPRTPLEPSLDRSTDRSLPMSLYVGKPAGSQESFAAVRPPSLSPQNSHNTAYNSPTNVVAMDYSSTSTRRGYLPPIQHVSVPGGSHMPYLSGKHSRGLLAQEELLDPVSALLKAGEIVDSGSRNRPQQ